MQKTTSTRATRPGEHSRTAGALAPHPGALAEVIRIHRRADSVWAYFCRPHADTIRGRLTIDVGAVRKTMASSRAGRSTSPVAII